MNQPSLERRVEVLEQKVENLSSLPERVASLENQFVQLRDEVRVGFSALHASDEETRKEMRALEDRGFGRRCGRSTKRRDRTSPLLSKN